MEFEELAKIVLDAVKAKAENHDGLGIFAKERAKFEGWLKVELCDSLLQYFNDVVPENDRIDVTVADWAIQLKTINTNYRFPHVKEKHRPITMNTQSVVDDINKLRSVKCSNKAVMFIAFPVKHDNKYWQKQLLRISSCLKNLLYVSFNFRNGIPGVIYFGLV